MRTAIAAAAAAGALAGLAFAPAGASAALSPRCAALVQRALRARSRAIPDCALREGAGIGGWGRLRGSGYAFDGLQVIGTMSARDPGDEDWSFSATSRTTIRPLGSPKLGGRFTLSRAIVVAAAEHVDYGIRGSATYTRSDGRQFDCTYDPPTGIDRFGMTLWPRGGRVAVRYNAYSGGWGCGDVVFSPSCQGDPGDADLQLYKPAAFARRTVRLPIDLRFTTGTGLVCEHRFTGYVRLKRLRAGR